ncbi:O-antigen ligase family protein [Aeromicrobium sp. Marseille-Q0843]|uniref:O-antigen ligase family protein n=1 Tax=Aeromicrobium phoceense TaxID=2754045 RepID=A0A838XCN9_9ACTN|nr:O-antigen ligase family protein [Aeromicrobium phoceense]MBA4607587.1 O-antigen ligase family protein [Aeromicrobium phoceense]
MSTAPRSRPARTGGTPTALLVLSGAGAIGAGLLVAARPQLGLALAAALASLFTVRLLRLTTLELVILTMPFMFFPPIGFLLNVSVADFLMPVLVVLTWTRGVRGSLAAAQRAVVHRFTALSVILLFVMTLSALMAALTLPVFDPRGAALDTMKLVVVLVWFLTLLVAFMALSERRLLRVARLWVWCATLQAAASLVGLAPSDGTRSLGWFQDPNLYAGYLLTSMALAFFVVSRDRLTAWPVVLLVLLGGVLATGSRGALAAAAVLLALAVVALISSRIGTLLMAGGVAALAVLLLVPDILTRSLLPGMDRLLSSAGNADTDPRWRLWSRGWELWTDHPLIGVGIGQYPEYSAGLTPFRNWTEGQVVHNTFLSFAAEGGLLGLLALVTIILTCVSLVRRADHLTRMQRAALLLGVIVIVVMMLTLNLQNLRYVWAFFAFAVAAAVTVPAKASADGD